MNSFWRYWGKAWPVEGAKARFHLLPYHCLDVVAVATCWWDSTASVRRAFVHALGVPEDAARAWVLFFIAPEAFPTCVGMNRRDPPNHHDLRSVPHVREDEPWTTNLVGVGITRSPRAWG